MRHAAAFIAAAGLSVALAACGTTEPTFPYKYTCGEIRDDKGKATELATFMLDETFAGSEARVSSKETRTRKIEAILRRECAGAVDDFNPRNGIIDDNLTLP